jgi:hypothetical protein
MTLPVLDRFARVVWAPLGDLGVCEPGDVGGVELLEFNRGSVGQLSGGGWCQATAGRMLR